MASPDHNGELHSLIALVKSLLNAQLKDVLRSEGLPVSGVKTTLQSRIIECMFPKQSNSHFFTLAANVQCADIKELIQLGQLESYSRLRKFIYACAHEPLPITTPHSSSSYQPHSAPPAYLSNRAAASGTMTPSPSNPGSRFFSQYTQYTFPSFCLFQIVTRI